MQVYKILKLLDLTGKTIPCDMQDQLSQTYFSESKQEPIAIGDMDIVHLIRAFNKMYGKKEAIDKLVFDYIQKQKGNNGSSRS
mgnify:FL=1|tara:strand:+ start:606 stop:854 length:249 start_codon:yes stop_codon:yes gene_type:complete